MGAIESVVVRIVDWRPTRAEALMEKLLLVTIPGWIVALEPRLPWLIAFTAAMTLIVAGAAAEIPVDVPVGDRFDETILRRLAAVLVLAYDRLPAALTANIGMGFNSEPPSASGPIFY